MSNTFPFAAIVGQEDMKLAMILTAIDPKIGGVLVFGDRGTGKSTAVRGLASLLPPINSVEGCPVNSRSLDEIPPWSENTSKKITEIPMPVVDLPLGIGSDRVTGALDIEKALVEGVKSFQPGLLAKANRGYLYIDEVNLLEDHIVDLLLDVSQSKENVIEREGLSIRHASDFILIGSGNPEEGELRPQLLDRFGLSVEVMTPQTVKDRIEIIKRRDLFDQDPEKFHNKWAKEDKKVIYAMKRGMELTITGISSKGTTVVDSYTLKGFTAAFNLLSEDLTFAGGNSIATTVTNNQVSIGVSNAGITATKCTTNLDSSFTNR